MAIPKIPIEVGVKSGKVALGLALHVTKVFGKVAGRQLKRGGPFSNELMQTYKNVTKALLKMK